MASTRRSSSLAFLLILIALALFLLTCTASTSTADDGSPLPELDAAEIEALGLDDETLEQQEEEEEDGGSFDDFGDEFPSDGEDDESSGFAPDPDVVVLSISNYTEFFTENHYAMVEFYAPWCGHCQALAPEYAKAATELKGIVPLAKVDATVESELAQQYNVQGYPTILFFVDGKSKPYSHHRTSEAIVTWIKKKVGPAVAEVATVGDAETVLETGNTVVVALLDKLEGLEHEEFASAARQEDDILFYQTTSSEVAEVFSMKKGTMTPALVVIKNATEKVVHYDGKFERVSLSEFITANKLPLVSTFSRDTATEIFESSIKKQLLLFAAPEEFADILPIYEEAAKPFKGKIIFVHVDSSNDEVGKPIVEFFGVTSDKPSVVAFTVSEDQPSKYIFEGEITVGKIKEFASDFLDGKLKEFHKSEPIPETNEGPVKVVVGNNFEEVVLDESKDVLLEIYAPWCGHCQSLEPIYEKLAKVLSSVESLVIAKMDGTVNEHPRGKADGFPTLLFFPAGNKSFDPITVDTDRTVKALYQFIKQNAAIPFKIGKSSKPETPTQEEAETSKATESAGIAESHDEL